MITCEVCVEGVPGALAAAQGGAHRLELCAGLVEGGTTPSLGTLRMVLERAGVDTVVLVRPRGGDFLYTREELDTILMDVEVARCSGAFGIATGVLTRDGSVDEGAMEEIMKVAGPMSVTFHRAFDMVRDAWGAMETLVGLGVDRILTSGQAQTAPEGQHLIREAVERAAGRISVMPGGGLGRENVREIVRSTGVKEVHFAALSLGESPMTHRNLRPLMGAARVPGEYERITTDPNRVRSIVGELAGLG
jgi:copper homeostasis protein